MSNKIRVGIIFGGKSAEHEVSLQSAKNVFAALDTEKYEPVLIGIGKDGRWYMHDAAGFLLHAENPKLVALNNRSQPLAMVPSGAHGQKLVPLSGSGSATAVDVIFPMLHGPFGEDGTVQGLLKLLDVPYVGAGVLGSALGMDKEVQKRLYRDAEIPTAKFMVLHKHLLHFEEGRSVHSVEGEVFARTVNALDLPFFVKPANLGSSVGIHKVKNADEFMEAIEDAFQYDTKIIIEEYIRGREIECSVLGNDEPIASVPGEIIPQHEFYSYEAKYIDEGGARLEIPAKLPEDIIERIQKLAVHAYKTLCLEGMSRVDFFLKENGEVLLNEVNTIPGFTNISMYPKLWEASGISYTELIDRLIQLAIERHEREKKLKTSVA